MFFRSLFYERTILKHLERVEQLPAEVQTEIAMRVGNLEQYGTQWSLSLAAYSQAIPFQNDALRAGALGANGGPNARADAGGTGTHPCSAALHPIKPSRPIRAARASPAFIRTCPEEETRPAN
jgi:hypothetical protein